MATPAEILQQMIDNIPSQVASITDSIAQIQIQIDDLDEQIDGIENGLCAVAESDLTTYLNGTKLTEIEALYGGDFDPPFLVDYGANYGTINYASGGITDWEIIDSLSVLVYKYEGLNWDQDSTIIKLITDYAFGNDYLTKPLSDSATYGLKPYKSALTTAKNILGANKTKIENSESIFEDYV